MKIKSIDIEGIGGVKSLHLDFDDHMNFICGPNGIGKTTVLECVAHSFSLSRTNILKRNVSSQHGSFKTTVEINGENYQSNVLIEDFDPDKSSQITGIYVVVN